MKLDHNGLLRCVTTTEETAEYIAASGFKYIDYSFGIDLNHKTGIFSDIPDG